jgi:acetyltransferase-like isoleucine patch superfamily enzyme
LGQSCNVREHLRVGRESLIGMGAVITKNVQPRSVMIGNPARKLRTRNKSSGSKN